MSGPYKSADVLAVDAQIDTWCTTADFLSQLPMEVDLPANLEMTEILQNAYDSLNSSSETRIYAPKPRFPHNPVYRPILDFMVECEPCKGETESTSVVECAPGMISPTPQQPKNSSDPLMEGSFNGLNLNLATSDIVDVVSAFIESYGYLSWNSLSDGLPNLSDLYSDTAFKETDFKAMVICAVSDEARTNGSLDHNLTRHRGMSYSSLENALGDTRFSKAMMDDAICYMNMHRTRCRALRNQ